MRTSRTEWLYWFGWGVICFLATAAAMELAVKLFVVETARPLPTPTNLKVRYEDIVYQQCESVATSATKDFKWICDNTRKVICTRGDAEVLVSEAC